MARKRSTPPAGAQGSDGVSREIGRRIKALRTERRGRPITQGEIAQRAQVSISFLSMIERGERSASIETLRQISEALGVSLEELFASEHSAPEASPAFQQLAAFLNKRKATRRQLQQLLEVAKAMFSD